MKIGTSFSQCIRDVVNGKVAIDDIVVICSRSNFSVEKVLRWREIWDWHKDGAWLDLDENLTKRALFKLWNAGKIHQPRIFHVEATWSVTGPIWYDLMVPEINNNDKLKEAWDNYQKILTEQYKGTV
jgi:hypothetical protein